MEATLSLLYPPTSMGLKITLTWRHPTFFRPLSGSFIWRSWPGRALSGQSIRTKQFLAQYRTPYAAIWSLIVYLPSRLFAYGVRASPGVNSFMLMIWPRPAFLSWRGQTSVILLNCE